MDEYMDESHPDAHRDFPEKRLRPEGQVECPRCFGWGGWNLTLNAYPNSLARHGLPDTAENRHKYVHFRASCAQCSGWGYTSAENARCVHELDGGRTVGRCLTEYTCKKCGKKETWDSSD